MKKFNKNIGSLFFVFFITHWGILLNYYGVYWDDWTLLNQDSKNIYNAFAMSGLTIHGVINNFLLLFPFGSFKVVIFICYLIIYIYYYDISIKQKAFFLRCNAILITIVADVLPFNLAKIAMINTKCTIGLAIFFTAWCNI